MPRLRKSPQLELVATDVSDLGVLHALKRFQLDDNRKVLLENALNAHLIKFITTRVSEVEVKCGALSFHVTTSKVNDNLDDTRPSTSESVDLTDFGKDGNLEFLRTEFDANPLTIGSLCSIDDLGRLATQVLISLETSGSHSRGLLFAGDSDCLRVLTTSGFPTDSVFQVDYAGDDDVLEVHQVLKKLGLFRNSRDNSVSIIRYMCSNLISRLAHSLAVILGVVIDKLEDRPVVRSDFSSTGSFSVSEPATVHVLCPPALNSEVAAHLKQYLSHYIQDCVLNRLVTIQ